MNKIQEQQTRYFEYMKPRYSNTYASENMGSSLFPPSGSPYLSKPKKIINNSEYFRNPQKNLQEKQSSQQSQRSEKQGNRKGSILSNYGSSSLGKLPKYTNQKQFVPLRGNETDIYEKQAKKYNIITMQPRQYSETIKKYPKFHLENLDTNFYKKLLLEDQYRSNGLKKPKESSNSYIYSHKQRGPVVENSDVRYYRNQDEHNQRNQGSFRAKMLNNVDELKGVV